MTSADLDEDEIHLQGELPVAALDLGVNDELVRAEKPLRYDLTVELLHDAVLVTGSLCLRLDCECSRCLKKFTTDLKLATPNVSGLPIIELPLRNADDIEAVEEKTNSEIEKAKIFLKVYL